MNKTSTSAQRNIMSRLLVWVLLVGGILLIPLVANFPWTGSDFMFAGVVLFGAALGYELATQNITDRKYRLAIGSGTLLMVLIIWGLAVAD